MTIIDGSGSDIVVRFESEETNGSILDGFTIQNGYANYGAAGAGINIGSGASPVVRYCLVINNNASTAGGAINSYGSGLFHNPNSKWEYEHAYRYTDGAFRSSGGLDTLLNCIFWDNNSDYQIHNEGGNVIINFL